MLEPVNVVIAALPAVSVVTLMLPLLIDTLSAFCTAIVPRPKLFLAPESVLAPVPPWLMASVPDITSVPAAVIGPPLKLRPLTVLLASTLVTVPCPVSVLQVGGFWPLEERT